VSKLATEVAIAPDGAAKSETTVPVRTAAAERAEPRRATGAVARNDVLALVGAAIAAISTTVVVFGRLAPFDSTLGFAVFTYVVFLAIYMLLVSLEQPGPIVRDRLAMVFVHSLAFVALVALAVVVIYTLWRGVRALSHLNFFVQDMSNAGPLQPLTVGGVLHAMIGTLEQIAIALAITVPLGIVCAVFLAEIPGPFSRFVRTIVEAMTALPSIVAGLFIYASAILVLGLDKSGLAAALAISVMMLPIIIRAADVVIRLVPGTLREASYALGSSQWRTVWHVVLPTARSGLTTAVILGTARGIGETSPVLLTAGFTAQINADPTHDPQISLPLLVFDLVRRPDPVMWDRGFGAASVLLALVLLLFVTARVLGGRSAGQLSRGQRRRRRIGSYRDAVRIANRHATAKPADPVEVLDD